jgi:phosphonate transport system permease protein
MSDTQAQINALYRDRPRNMNGRVAVVLALGVVAVAWVSSGILGAASLDVGRFDSMALFIHDSLFRPLVEGQGLASLVGWVWGLMIDPAAQAMWLTMLVATAGILLAQCVALPLSLLACRTLATVSPFEPNAGRGTARRAAWWLVRFTVRAMMAVWRSIPAYLWAFLLIGVLGVGAWPAVLALALHNAGVLGRLNAELFESHADQHAKALRRAGANRLQIASTSLILGNMPRLVAMLFYRAEICIRESTVIGLVGLATLGYWVSDARARDRYDVMLFMIGLTVVLVALCEIGSAIARRWAR